MTVTNSMPLEFWITNTSPLIALAKIGHLELLADTSRQVLVPNIVTREVLRGPEDDPARQALPGGWGVPIAVPVIPPSVQALDAGETAVLAAALARREGRIAAAPVLHALQSIGLYIDDQLIHDALIPLGEEWP